jgi:hypothetical protein
MYGIWSKIFAQKPRLGLLLDAGFLLSGIGQFIMLNYNLTGLTLVNGQEIRVLRALRNRELYQSLSACYPRRNFWKEKETKKKSVHLGQKMIIVIQAFYRFCLSNMLNRATLTIVYSFRRLKTNEKVDKMLVGLRGQRQIFMAFVL